MKAHLDYLKYRLDSSFWFVPGLMIIGAIVLSFAMVALDRTLVAASVDVSGWLYSATPDGARQLLTTIASSIITVTSLVFSMTLIALTLASQQLGPRLLENFMRNKPNQLVLGFFVATFVYSLLVLRTVSDIDGAGFVPSCATVLAIVMSIFSFAILIFFIHHVAESIQADSVIANVSDNLDRLIAVSFDRKDAGLERDEPNEETAWPEDFDERAIAVCGTESGYIQTLDIESLKKLAIDESVVLKLDCRPGHFVVEGHPVAYVYSRGEMSDQLPGQVFTRFVIGPKRTTAQDVEYEIRVIAEIAVRALSPGINDYYTAVTCIDRLTAAIVSIMNHDVGVPDIYDEAGKVVLRTVPPDFGGLLDTAFNDIRQCAHGITAVTIRLLESLAVLAQASKDRNHSTAIERHVEMVGRAAAEFIYEPCDKADAEARLKTARDLLQAET